MMQGSEALKGFVKAIVDMVVRVLMVSEYFVPHGMGGGENSALALARALVKKGLQVHVLTSRFPGDPGQDIIEGIHIHRRLKTGTSPDTLLGNVSRLGFTASVIDELPTAIKALRPDVVHALNITSMPGVAHVARRFGIPCIAHINSPLAFCPKGTLLDGGRERTRPYTFSSFVRSFVKSNEMGRLSNSWFMRYNPLQWLVLYKRWSAIRDSFPAFAHFFAISTAMKEWLVKYGVSPSKITVLYNLIALDAFAAKSQPNKVPKLLYLGGYVSYKGLDKIIAALSGITAPYELHAYGSGPDRAAFAQKSVSNARITLHDEVPLAAVPHLMRTHDALVFPSQLPEGLGRVAIEAMAAGKPVIASDIGGMRDTVVHGVTGLLVPPADVLAWRKAIELLISDGALRERMGSAGKQRAALEFAHETIINRAIDAYQKVLA